MANKVQIKINLGSKPLEKDNWSTTWETAIGADGHYNAVALAKKLKGKVQAARGSGCWQIIDERGNLLAMVSPLGTEDDLDITGATQQNIPTAINSTQDALNTNVSESTKKILVKESPEGKGPKSIKNWKKWTEKKKKKSNPYKKDEGKKEINESGSVVNFLKSFSQKNYAQANKYLEEVLSSKLKCRIKAASQDNIFQ